MSRFAALSDDHSKKKKAKAPAAAPAAAAPERRDNRSDNRGGRSQGAGRRDTGQARQLASGEYRQPRHQNDRRSAGPRQSRGPRNDGADKSWGNQEEDTKAQADAIAEDTVVAVTGEGETKAAPKVEEPEEPPTQSLEEFQKAKADKMVKVANNTRATRNGGFQGKTVSAKASPVAALEQKKEVRTFARKAISIAEFSPAPARRNDYERRDDGRGRGRGDGRGRGRGRGDGRGRGRGQGRYPQRQQRGPRTMNLKDDSNFPKVGQ